ncbi:MAG: PQQ-binding-like beta-propeller repeat protein [Planctomycetota bacterium]|jgi:outer membrane protein assembly factor BamB
MQVLGKEERRFFIAAMAGVVAAGVAVEARGEWPQWGGPKRNFTVETTGLADKWPEDGPKKIWYRELGDGYSSILFSDGVLYTMYRRVMAAKDEVSVALDATTGKTIWEHRFSAPLTKPVDDSGWGGKGPNATPLIVADRIFTVGSHAVLHCLDKKTGTVVWMRDLAAEFGAPYPNAGQVGYSASPIAYKNTIIIPAGSKRPGNATGSGALIAFDQATGDVKWRTLDFEDRTSSPILINFHGQDQLVLHCPPGIVGVDPSDGKLLWSRSFDQNFAIVTPMFDGTDLLFCAPGRQNAAGRVLRLTEKDGETAVDSVWTNSKIRLFVPSPIQVGKLLFGSNERVFFGADIESGKRLWVKRGFHFASCVYGDGKLIMLDQDGQLTLAIPKSDGLTISSQCEIGGPYSYVVPTLVGKTLYLRDRKYIMALDVGKGASGETG